MKVVLTDQYANILLLVNGLALVFYLGAKKKKKQRAMKFGNYQTLQKVAGKNFLKSSNIILLTRMLALTTLIIGISSPVLVEQKPSTSTDYVIAIDSSSSMLAGDIEPTRFEAAKKASTSFVDQLGNSTEVGVVSFAGEVQKQQKLTPDKTEVKASINRIEVGSTAGTAIGNALYTSSSMLLESNRSKTVLLITDGRNNVGTLNESINFAQSHNITVNAIGIGEKRNSSQRFGIVDGVNATKADYPNIDTRQLFRISNSTGGELVTVANRSAMKNAFISFEKTRVRTDLSRYFIFAALFLMLLEWVLGTTKYSILP